ncbi:MAG: hypothetical protein M3179_12750 [Actinomycetota bacterium]|nr:hypothetical protein [Actinomycetota bacterium]
MSATVLKASPSKIELPEQAPKAVWSSEDAEHQVNRRLDDQPSAIE